MARRLRHVVIETGECRNCGKDAGFHSIEGSCSLTPDTFKSTTVFEGDKRIAYLDLNSGEVRVLLEVAAGQLL